MPKLIWSNLKSKVKSKGGKLLTAKYPGDGKRARIRCKFGHTWAAQLRGIVYRGNWCPYCAGRHSGSIKRIEAAAKERGGTLLSKRYKNSKTKYLIRCSEGHLFRIAPTNLFHGKWCKRCGLKASGLKRLGNLSEVRSIIRKRGGKLNSTEYPGNSGCISVTCGEGHTWSPIVANIKLGTWCPTCAGKGKYNLKFLRKLAKERGGKVLSAKMANHASYVEFRCASGHKWSAKAEPVVAGTWCPKCPKSIGEEIVRSALEHYFEMPFPRERPQWLRGLKGKPLELDGYCKELNIAFEHHGRQHYGSRSLFLREGKNRKDDISRDALKRKLCRKHDIVLIEVPEVFHKVRLKDLPDFLEKVVKRLGVARPGKAFNVEGALASAHASTKLDSMKVALAEDGYKLLQNRFVASLHPVLMKCPKGHEVLISLTEFKRGRRCKHCKEQALTLSRFKALIERLDRHGFKAQFPSKQFEGGSKRKMPFMCKSGHLLKKLPRELDRNPYCNQCRVDELGSAIARRLKKIGAKFVGQKRPKTVDDRFTIKCSNGHSWKVSGYVILKTNRKCNACRLEKQ